jgi:ABC-type spermidine/putrescine transport system permease subunit I
MESLTKSSKLIKKEGFKIVVFLLLTFILIRLMYLFIETPYTLSYLFLSDSKDYQWIVTSWSYFTLVCQSILHPIFYFVLFEYQLGEHEKNIR